MKKLFNIFLIFLFLAFRQLANAQEHNYEKTIKAGFIIPLVNYQTNAPYLDGYGYGSANRPKNSIGFGLALQYAIPMNKYISFNPELGLNYIQFSDQLDGFVAYEFQQGQVTMDAPWVLALKGKAIRPFIKAGARTRLNVYNSMSTYWNASFGGVRKVNFSPIVGTGLQWKTYLVEVEYNHGTQLENTIETSSHRGHFQMNMVRVSLGYTL